MLIDAASLTEGYLDSKLKTVLRKVLKSVCIVQWYSLLNHTFRWAQNESYIKPESFKTQEDEAHPNVILVLFIA